MNHVTRVLFPLTVLGVGLIVYGLTPASSSTLEDSEAAVELIAQADTAAPTDAPQPREPCEGIVGSVRSELPIPSQLGEILVAAFPVGVLGADAMPKSGVPAAANFYVLPDPETAIAPEVEPDPEAAASEGAETGTSEPEAPGLRVAYHLCLDAGEYDVVAFLDANNDGRIWNPGDHHGSARVVVPGEGIVNADVYLSSKVTTSSGKKGGDWDKAGPTSPPPANK